MFDKIKKLFTRPVNQVDIMTLELYGTTLESMERIRDSMTVEKDKTRANEKIEEVRTLFVKKLCDIVHRAHIHGQMPA